MMGGHDGRTPFKKKTIEDLSPNVIHQSKPLTPIPQAPIGMPFEVMMGGHDGHLFMKRLSRIYP